MARENWAITLRTVVRGSSTEDVVARVMAAYPELEIVRVETATPPGAEAHTGGVGPSCPASGE